MLSASSMNIMMCGISSGAFRRMRMRGGSLSSTVCSVARIGLRSLGPIGLKIEHAHYAAAHRTVFLSVRSKVNIAVGICFENSLVNIALHRCIYLNAFGFRGPLCQARPRAASYEALTVSRRLCCAPAASIPARMNWSQATTPSDDVAVRQHYIRRFEYLHITAPQCYLRPGFHAAVIFLLQLGPVIHSPSSFSVSLTGDIALDGMVKHAPRWTLPTAFESSFINPQAKLAVLVKCDLLMDLTPKAAHEKDHPCSSTGFICPPMPMEIFPCRRVSPPLLSLRVTKTSIAAAQDNIGDYLLIVRALLGLVARHELVLGFYDLEKLLRALCYKVVAAGYVTLNFFCVLQPIPVPLFFPLCSSFNCAQPLLCSAAKLR